MIFTKPVILEEGDYLLSTGNRRSDGAILADLVSFQVEAGKLTNIDMLIRPCVEKMEILGVVPTVLSIVPEGKTKGNPFAGEGVHGDSLDRGE